MGILDSVPGAIAAWSTSRQLLDGFLLAPAEIAGGAYTLIRDQYCNRDASPSGAPAAGSGAINGNGYCRLDGTNDKFRFAALPLGSGDWTIFLAVGFPGTPIQALIGFSTTGASVRHASSTTFSLQADSGGAGSLGTNWIIAKGFHVLRIERDGAAGTINIFQNGEAVGNGAGRSLAGSFTFDQFGAQQAACWSTMGFGECIIYPGLLDTGQIAQLEADMAAAWRSGICADATAGNDANTGWEPGQALQTISAIRGMDLRRGSKVMLKCGETWRRDPILFNRNYMAATADQPIVVDCYHCGDKPRLVGSTPVGGPYTNVSGQEYQATATLTNVQCVWAYDGSGKITRLVAGTAGALTPGQYAMSGGNLRFNVGAVPTAFTFECAQQDGALVDTNGCRLSKTYIQVRNLHVLHWPADGVCFDHDNCSATGILSEWNANDGIGGGALNLYLGQSVSRNNGKGRALSGPAGDGVSLHGFTSIVIEDVTCLYNDKAGIDHQETVNAIMRCCWLEGNNQNIVSASLTGTPGTQVWENCVVVRRPGDYARACQFIRSTTHAVRQLTVVNLDAETGSTGLHVASSGHVTVENAITDGFHTGVQYVSGTYVQDHNLHNDTVNYSGVSAGTGDVSGDPLFTDRAAADFTLQSGSPAVGAGADLGVPYDYLHNPRPPSPTDIGAFACTGSPPPFPSLILDQVTGALAAWSTGRQLSSSFTQAPADVAGGIYTLLRDQVGGNDATPVGSPPAGSGGPLPFAQLDGATQKFSFTSVALGTGDWTICMAVKFAGTAAGPFIGRTATTTSIRQSGLTNIDLRSDSSGPQPYGMATVSAGFHVLRIARDGATGTVQIWLDGTAIGNGLPRSISGVFTFDQFGAQRSSDAWANIGIGEVIVFQRLLSATDADAMDQNLAAGWG